MKRSYLAVLAALAFAFVARADVLDVSGTWEASLGDPVGASGWRAIRLPGTLDDFGLGTRLAMKPEISVPVLAHLQRRYSYVGPAWYRREVEIPASWSGKKITLELERVLWASRVFVDGKPAGYADSLTAPHRHDLTGLLTPGCHELLVCIDNSEIHPDISFKDTKTYASAVDAPLAHAYTNHTQTMWNGILGAMRLHAEDSSGVSNLAVTGLLSGGAAIKVSASVTREVAGAWQLELIGQDGSVLVERDVNVSPGCWQLEWKLPPGLAIHPWDEFDPTLYRLAIRRTGSADCIASTTVGFRELSAKGTQLRLNGRRIFLRGNLDCAVFPLTGYPPTDLDSWLNLLGTAKKWGLNHIRFHSWCPPAAAFDAADRLGLYLQIELPHWSLDVGRNPSTWKWLQDEAVRMLDEYGNHPSFMFLSLGNELQGDMTLLHAEVADLRKRDPRRLYTSTTFTFERGHGRTQEPGDDYFVTQYTEAGWVRGQGVFNELPPSFDADYGKALHGVTIPLVAHEVGQYSVYPDLREIASFTGNLVPLNLVAIRDDLQKKGLLALAPEFTAASARFAMLLYKEEIERNLRTAQMSGFQLLSLQDYPGQGTALVGLVDSFWRAKGTITPGEFREFCGPVVPLACFAKATYVRGETFVASVQVSDFYRPLPGTTVNWSIHKANGDPVSSGTLGPVDIEIGNGKAIGEISMTIPAAGPAEQWILELSLAGTRFRNHWNLWVYPKDEPQAAGEVVVAASLTNAEAALASGKRVLFTPPISSIVGIPGRFVPVFWSPVHFPDQPGTMGLLCDPRHPALAGFPTESHSDWQWWDLALNSRSVVIDSLSVTPIVRVIDNFQRNHSLANIFEARVGPGRLLFCAIDVSHDLAHRPAARALRASLLRYAGSQAFMPSARISRDELRALVHDSNAHQ